MVKNKLLRWLLWPFAWLYAAVVLVRGWMYDCGILHSESVAVPTLVVGNLAVGGTGKSPMVRYLLEKLTRRGVEVAMLSRGYGRKTHGFRLVDAAQSLASEVGDEPLMVARGAEGVTVAVCEDRVRGCRELISMDEGLGAVVLDDAYQHRRLRAKVYMLLTAYDRLYVDDYPMPVGRLRDVKRQAWRASVVVVTKCPPQLSREQAEQVASRLRLRAGQTLLFATEVHGDPYPLAAGEQREKWVHVGEVVALAGIAHPKPFFDWLAWEKQLEEKVTLRDHARIGSRCLARLQQCAAEGRKIVTTEKDAVRLQEAAKGNETLLQAIWVAPIAVRWLFDGEKKIEELLDGLLR